MKRTALAVAGIAVLAAAVWSGLWFAGRGQVTDRLDHEIAMLRAGGIEITHGAREIGGFPFGYRVSHRDVTIREATSGAVYRLPEISTEATAEDIDRLVTKLPEKFRIDLPVHGAVAGADGSDAPGQPEILGIDVEAQNLVIVSDGLPATGQTVSATASSVLIAMGGADQPLNLAIELQEIDSRATLPARNSGIAATGAITASRIEYAFAGTSSAGIDFSIQGGTDNPRLTGRSDGPGPVALPSLLTGAQGSAALTYQTGRSLLEIRSVAEAGHQGGTLTLASGSAAGTLSILDGIIEFASSSRANNVTLQPEQQPGAAEIIRLGAALRTVEAMYKAPLAPSEAMAPFTVRFALDEVAPDETLWRILDAAGAMPRDPARLVVDIEGTGRITKQFADTRPGEAVPVEFGNVSIRSVDMNALGARITTRGDVEFLQPLNLPLGGLTVTLENVMQVLGRLVDAGLVGLEVSQTAAALASIYTAPGTAAGQLVAEIELTAEGITVNGQRVEIRR